MCSPSSNSKKPPERLIRERRDYLNSLCRSIPKPKAGPHHGLLFAFLLKTMLCKAVFFEFLLTDSFLMQL